MKKFVLFILFSLLVVCKFDFGYVNADSTSDGMGFQVDTTRYGTNMDTDSIESYTYYYNYKGVPYVIGYSRIKTAVYSDQTDPDWASVIIQTTTNPIDVWVSGWFGIKSYFDSVTVTQRIYSDIDDGFKNYGYGAYTTATGFEMEQPSPMEEPSTTTYTAGIEISDVVKISGSVTFDISELYLTFNHRADLEKFDTTYNYQCSGNDCSYMNGLTYNKATFLVDMNYNVSTAGTFVNNSYVDTLFKSCEGIYYTAVIPTTTLHAYMYY
jgi:hypothetical protein